MGPGPPALGEAARQVSDVAPEKGQIYSTERSTKVIWL